VTYIVAVTGGKGGTGKSTIAVNLATTFALRGFKVVLADMDVEAPNDHILFGVQLENQENVYSMIPFFKLDKCIRCGVCSRVCSESAIIISKAGFPFIIPKLCSGCRACKYACPTKAIVEGSKLVGRTYMTNVNINNKNLILVTGELVENEERSFPVSLATRIRAERLQPDILIIDSPPGTSNIVAIALDRADLVIAVTEPTPLGAHDLNLILELVKEMKLKAWVVINKANIGDEGLVVNIVRNFNIPIVSKLPYSEYLIKSYVNGEPLVLTYPETTIATALTELSEQIVKGVMK